MAVIVWRRARRRQAREQNGKRAEHNEGLSSDDEETSTDITSFNTERGKQQPPDWTGLPAHLSLTSRASFSSTADRIIKECKKVFEDVVEDFHSLDFIKSHFEVWRRDFAESYRDAYIGLCLPKLFNPLVRLQLTTWNPLEVRETHWVSSFVF